MALGVGKSCRLCGVIKNRERESEKLIEKTGPKFEASRKQYIACRPGIQKQIMGSRDVDLKALVESMRKDFAYANRMVPSEESSGKP